MLGRWCVLFLAVKAISCAETAGLRVEVLDPTEAVISNAQVILRRAGTKEPIQIADTDQLGRCLFSRIEAGVYEIEISREGFVTRMEHVHVGNGETQISLQLAIAPIGTCQSEWLSTPNVGFEPAGQETLEGAVLEPRGILLPKVTVSLRSVDRKSRPLAVKTDTKGLFAFHDVKPGLYRLRAMRPGYSDFIIDSIEVKLGHRTRVEDPIEMLRCPSGMHCQPNRKVHQPGICL